MSRRRHCALLHAAIALNAVCCSEVRAAEAIRPAGPIGGTDIQQAILPPPGFYMAAVVAPVDLFRFSTPYGSMAASGHSVDAGIGLLWVYGVQVFGGKLASSVSVAYGHSCFQTDGQQKVCSKAGLDDSYVDLLVWSRFFPSQAFGSQPDSLHRIPFGLNLQIGLGVVFPTGTYDARRPLNNSSNIYDIAPNIALTYNTHSLLGRGLGDSTELSMRVWLNNYAENHATHYQSGRLFNVDFSLTQRLKQWQYGVWGTAFKQFQDDAVSGIDVPNGGARAHGVAIGPLVSYSFVAGGRPWNITCKGLYAISAMNAAWPRGLVLRVATRF